MTDACPTAAIDVCSLTHRYDAGRRHGATPGHTALNDLTCRVEVGEVFGVLGPNGSGKSTLFRILATLLPPTKGGAQVLGRDVQASAMTVRHLIGVMFQSPSVDLQLTARENLHQQGHMYGVDPAILHDRTEALLEEFELANRGHETLERFSGGMRRRVELAKALIHQPRVILLDEPSTGLDPAARRGMWDQLDRLRRDRGMTIAITTHLMEDAARCSRLLILNQGRLVALDTPQRLTTMFSERVVQLKPADPSDLVKLQSRVEAQFGPWPAGGLPVIVDGQVRFEHREGADVVSQLAHDHGERLRSFSVAEPDLEDVFLRLTGNRFTPVHD